jgi:hypothetical protein
LEETNIFKNIYKRNNFNSIILGDIDKPFGSKKNESLILTDILIYDVNDFGYRKEIISQTNISVDEYYSSIPGLFIYLFIYLFTYLFIYKYI